MEKFIPVDSHPGQGTTFKIFLPESAKDENSRGHAQIVPEV